MPKRGVASSSEFRLFETETFRKMLLRISGPRDPRGKLESYVYPQLRREPFHGPHIRKLVGYDPPTWRYRVGPWRVFYLVDRAERIVYLLAIDDRKDAYR